MLKSLLKTVLFGGAVGVTFIDMFGYVARVEGESMSPTLNPHFDTDYVFLSKFQVRDYKVNRGDIVCLVSPKDPKQRIIKRVIAREGDVVLTVGYREKYVKIPPGSFWIEGDHINNSLDSNTFGPVSLGLLTAKATHIVWPPSRWRPLSSVPVRQPIKFGKNESLKS